MEKVIKVLTSRLVRTFMGMAALPPVHQLIPKSLCQLFPCRPLYDDASDLIEFRDCPVIHHRFSVDLSDFVLEFLTEDREIYAGDSLEP